MKKYFLFIVVAFASCEIPKPAVVFQTDFGLKDGAVSEMKGVAFSVESGLHLYDITHEIPTYNIWEAAYRLSQVAPLWPKGTVFVSVVDPGVGTERKSIVMKTSSGHFFVSPDNFLDLTVKRFKRGKASSFSETSHRHRMIELIADSSGNFLADTKAPRFRFLWMKWIPCEWF